MKGGNKADISIEDHGLTWTLAADTDRGFQWLKEVAGADEPEIELEAEQAERLCARARAAGLIVDRNL
jgi:hypothetical protein